MDLPYKGIKVLSFGQAVMAPAAARLMADLGAEVLKIEPLEGDFSRISPTNMDPPLFLTLNRNKRSIALNIRDPRGKEIALKLAKDADVIIQNLRPGAMERMGLDYKSVSKINPRLIYLSQSCYGQTGPLAHRRGADFWAEAFAGWAQRHGGPGMSPSLTSAGAIDAGTGALGAFAIAVALFQREQTGMGQEVQASLVNTACFLQENIIAYYLIDGLNLKKGGRGGPRGEFPVGCYTAKDGEVVTMFGQDDYEWPIVCSLLGIEYLLDDPRYDTHEKRKEHKGELYPILDEAFSKKTRDEWAELFRQQGLRCDPALDYAEMVEHPQFKENDMLVETEHRLFGKIRSLGSPVKFTGVVAEKPKRPCPVLGEHSKEVLRELGYSAEEIEKLADEGVIGAPTSDMLTPKVRKMDLSSHVMPITKGTLRKRSELKARKTSK